MFHVIFVIPRAKLEESRGTLVFLEHQIFRIKQSKGFIFVIIVQRSLVKSWWFLTFFIPVGAGPHPPPQGAFSPLGPPKADQ
jgi:hypothetical protein